MANNNKLNPDRIFGGVFPPGYTPRVKLYDFHRPDKFSREQIRTMSIIHETMSRNLSITLSQIFAGSAPVEARVSLVDQLAYYEFVEMLEEPAAVFIRDFQPLKGHIAVQIDTSLVYTWIDRLCGGSSDIAVPEHQLEAIEARLLRLVGEEMTPAFTTAWWFIDGLHSQVQTLETQKEFIQIVPPTEMLILVELTLTHEGRDHKIRLAYPYRTIEPIIDRLSAKYWYAQTRTAKTTEASPQIAANLKLQASVDIRLHPCTVKELSSLKVGDKLNLPARALENLEITCNETPVAQARWKNPGPHGSILLEPRSGDATDLTGNPNHGLTQLLEARFQELSAQIQSSLACRDSEVGVTRAAGGTFNRGPSSSPSSSPDGASRQNHPQNPKHPQTPKPQNPDFPASYTFDGDIQSIFDSFSPDDGDFLYAAISTEYPQIQAAILAQLSSPLAADYIARLDEQARSQVLKRIIAMKSCHQSVLSVFAAVLKDRLNTNRAGGVSRAGGIEKAVSILNYSARAVEASVIIGWDKSDPELSESVKQRMFVFEDIVLLNDDALQKLIDQVNHHDLILALKQLHPEVRQRLAQVLGETPLTYLEQEARELGPVRISEVEAAQLRIVFLVRELEQAGEILIARAGEVVE